MIGAVNPFRIGSPGASVVDAEGRTTRAMAWTTVEDGRVDELAARDVTIAAQVGQTHDIVCLAPLETLVDDRMTVEVTTPERLAGLYAIDVIRTTRRHVRLLCSRSTVKDA